MKKNILITGGTGFIGGNLIKSILALGFTPIVLFRNEPLFRLLNVKYLSYNNDFSRLIKENNVHGIIHLASAVLVNHENKDIPSLINTNILLGTQLLEAAVKYDVKWFINTGTFWQHYENANYNPVNLYAATKQAFEDISKYYYETSDLVFTTLKLNDTFGKGDPRKKIFNLWKENLASPKPLSMSPGQQIIDINHIDNVCEAFICLIKNLEKNNIQPGASFSLKSTQRLSLKALSQLFEKIADQKLNIDWGALPYRPREVMIPYLKDPMVPGYKEVVSLEDGVQDFLN